MPDNQLIIHVTNKHKCQGPKQVGTNIHVWIGRKQKQCFVHIAESLDATEPVSYAELCLKMTVSVGTVQHYIRRLKAMGLIWKTNSARSLRLTEMGQLAWDQFKAKKEGKNGVDEGR